MKHIKLKILSIILLSVLLLFSAFSIILNVTIPHFFENQAKEALTYEINYIWALWNAASTDEEKEIPVEEYNNSYFSGDIYSFYINDQKDDILTETPNTKPNPQILISEITNYCNEKDIEYNKCYTLKTSNGYYVFLKFDNSFWINETDNSEADAEDNLSNEIMYINITSLVQYTKSLNWFLAALFICIASAMSIIGLRLGRKIEEAQESQCLFFQNSSHELKTPLMAIQGYAEGLQEGVVDPKSSADIILQESDRMTKLVEEILYISRIDAHQMTLDTAVFDIREVLYDCMRFVEPLQLKRKIEIKPDFCSNAVFVECDEMQLAKAFTNILANAIRHCKKTIVISCREEKRNVVIKVEDDGDGISKDDLSHIFDRFYTGKNGNTGIGLALTKEIITLHKGTVIAYNKAHGAVFEIRLPLA